MRALVIDLNNFARYPTLPVGLIVAVLRREGIDVDVLSPLARGVRGYPRLTRARPWGLLDDRLRYWSAVSPSPVVRTARNLAAHLVQPGGPGDRDAVLAYALEMLERRPDVVLISAYTMYEETCSAIARACKARGVPVLVGGNYFVAPQVVERWLQIAGVSAVYGGEPERDLASLVADLAVGNDLSSYSGVSVPGKTIVPPAAPLLDLDSLPFPDYQDFPWSLYPNRIVPIMTGRGCGWGRCLFCSDVITSAGRTFRSRSLDNVLDEIQYQHARHGASLFAFLDLKLNSDVQLWRGLLDRMPDVMPAAAWTASVHVDTGDDHGLFRRDLVQARRAGLARVTTGLESASGRLLRRMAKGVSLERMAEFVRDAAESDISVRLTAITGYPGEDPRDVEETSTFLERHARWIERVTLHRFSLMLGSELDLRASRGSPMAGGIVRGAVDASTGIVRHSNAMWRSRAYRRAVYGLMGAVHRINRRPLRERAREFEGVM
jgi:anaerobic magnesium-protoporphyrin IX monomethyl ester cyclase